MNVDGVRSAAFNGDDSQILTVSADGVARLWDPAGNELAVLDASRESLGCRIQS
jgi:WD40 repeat protein